MEIVKLKSLFSDSDNLISRYDGLIVRKNIEKILENDNKVVIDFEGFVLITQSFGDEIIGVIVRNKGVEFVKNHIGLINTNGQIKDVLNFVVSYSKKMKTA
ncbi:STAS-like domain-containing protein [Thermodesulfobium sp. 4217-1]|uniref:STAS-like domain-containing protein n=1 Tax=Thermodesulfobium sp. 4217-1 TaxID=3120013 RepID=UPI00322182CE